MSALLELAIVIASALIPLVAISVSVQQVIDFRAMEPLVEVSI